MPIWVAIIADDLTGALDSAAPFASRGLCTMVYGSPEHVPINPRDGVAVVAVNTGSREKTLAEAVRSTETAARKIRDMQPSLVLKKVDSRLKGHVAAEIAVCADIFSRKNIIVAPAIPAFGRVVRGGFLRGSNIDSPIDVAARAGGRCLVPDITSNDDFGPVVECAAGDGGMLLAGARGVAEAIAKRIGGPLRACPSVARPFLFAIGSVDPVTRVQLRRLDTAVAGEGDIAIMATSDIAGPASTAPARDFATSVAAYARRNKPATIFVTGGETAAFVMEALGVAFLAVEGEILPGIVQTMAVVDERPVRVLTKSGGFGGPETLIELWGKAKAVA